MRSITKKSKNIVIKRDYIGNQDMKGIFAEILKTNLLKLPPLPPLPTEHPFTDDCEFWWECGMPPENGEMRVTIMA